MNYYPFITGIFLAISSYSFGQTIPEQGAKLNYTQIMFDHDPIKGADEYLVEVIEDKKDGSFEQPLYCHKDSSTATLISQFEFGKKYKWCYTGLRNGQTIRSKGPYNFEIPDDIHVHKNSYRVKVLVNDSSKNNKGLITLDMMHTIADQSGNIVWFLPLDTGRSIKEPLRNQHNRTVSDLRVTETGTLTLIDNSRAEERNLKGSFLWIAPKHIRSGLDSMYNPSDYNYHHCIKRLANGDYMVLDKDITAKPSSLFGTIDSTYAKKHYLNEDRILIANETIKEFDRNGNLIWHWSSEDYFDNADLKTILQNKPDSGLLNAAPGGHLNSFDVDQNNRFIYAGFRTVSRIVKIDKKSGKVVCSWGPDVTYQEAPNGNGFFLKQHESKLLHDGTIAVFNNSGDSINNSHTSSSNIKIFTQPSRDQTSNIIWEFECRFDSINYKSFRGGNVDELKNGNLLVCMGAINRIFEVTRDKKIVWSSIIEKYDEHQSKWVPFPIDRAHYSSSLYPCYFTIQSDMDSLSKMSSTFHLKIFNDGSEPDSYQIEIRSPSSAYNKQFITDTIPCRKSASFEIAADKKALLKNENVVVTVTSKTNPDFIRSMTIQYWDF